jgi:hypothetical protein
MGLIPDGRAPEYAAVADVPANSFAGPGGFLERRGAPKLVGRSAAAQDMDSARRLWDASVHLTGIRLPLGAPTGRAALNGRAGNRTRRPWPRSPSPESTRNHRSNDMTITTKRRNDGPAALRSLASLIADDRSGRSARGRRALLVHAAAVRADSAPCARPLDDISAAAGTRGGPKATLLLLISRRLDGLPLLAFAVVEEDHGTLLPIARRCLRMCEEWWMWRRRREADEARGLWDEFERTPPVSEPERIDEREVTLEEREPTPTVAES